MGTVVIAVAIVAFVVVAAFLVYASRVKKVGPNEVLVISGRGKGVNGFRIITGGRAFVWPVLERVDMLSLELMTIELTTPDVPTVQGVPSPLTASLKSKSAATKTPFAQPLFNSSPNQRAKLSTLHTKHWPAICVPFKVR